SDLLSCCATSAAESPRSCWSSWAYWDESVRLPERFLGAAESFTLSCFSTPIAASLAWPATRPCWHAIFKYRKANSRQKRSQIPARRLRSTLLRSARFPHYRARGSYQASCTTWRPDLLRSSYRQRRFVVPKCQVKYWTQLKNCSTVMDKQRNSIET